MKKWNIWKRGIAVSVAAVVLVTDQSIIYAADRSAEPETLEEGEEAPALPEENETAGPEEGETSQYPEEDSGIPKDNQEQDETDVPEGDRVLPEGAGEVSPEDNGDLPQSEQPKEPELPKPQEEQTQEAPEEEAKEQPEAEEDTEPLEEERHFKPHLKRNSSEEDAYLWDQPLIGQEDDEEPYTYTESYGNQLKGQTERALYEQLQAALEENETAISLGEITTDAEELEGEAYEAFVLSYEEAAQYAFDAWYYDYADAEYLDTENSELVIKYEGIPSEDGTTLWTVEASWELAWEEDTDKETEETIPSAEEGDTCQTLRTCFDQILNSMGQEESTESSARMFQRLCDQAEITCILVKGIVEEELHVWNMVQMEDENWYLVDTSRNVFLKGDTEEMQETYQMYGDFSNSHRGFFAYPEIGSTDYLPADTDATVTTPEDKKEAGDQMEDSEILPSQEPAQSETPEETRTTKPDTETQTGTEPMQPAEPNESIQPEHQTQQSEALPATTPSEKTISENVETKTSDDLMSQSAAQNPAEPSAPAQEELSLAQADQAAEEVPETARAVQEKVLEGISVSGIKPQTYTGRAITPKVVVKDSSTNKKLKEGSQYTISYENNIHAGTATVVIRGVEGSGYDGVCRVDFPINPQNIAKKVKAKVLGKGFAYTGLPITPGVEISYNKTGLTAGVDYQVEYLQNTEKGNAQIQLTGIGDFTGTKVLKFKITPKNMKDTTVSLSSYSDIYGGEGALPTVSVSYEGGICREGIDYTVKYPKKLKVGKNVIQVVGRGSFKGSVKLTYMIGKASIEDAEIHFPYAWKYTSKNIKVMPTSVTVDGVSLQPKKDYTIKYQAVGGKRSGSVKKPGAYQIILTGKGNYQGSMVFDFCITDSQEVLDQNYNSAESTIKKPDLPPTPDTSPDEELSVEKDRYWGYYEQYKITSKKGIQGVSNYTEDTEAQHILLNVNMADLISTRERSGFIPYTYRGKTYYFGDLIALKDTIYHLHGWGGEENPYGANRMRNVTLVLLMGWDDELSYLIHPSARKQGAAPYYALNMQDSISRDTFEALFRYMGEEFGSLKTRVSNWTLGNEVNSCKEWNYSGNLSLNDCVANYAQAFQLLYKGVKRGAKSSRVFISLDHCWTASVAGHSGKSYLDQFAAYMNQTAPQMEWNVNYHPYSQPLTRVNFWSDNTNTTSSSNTKYISMKNIQVLTDYLKSIESRYGKPDNSIRVIIGELGYTGQQGDPTSEASQAAAIGYGYYIALFNTRIDSYIIRAYLDAPAETSTGLYFGLRDQNHNQKTAYDVYKYLDSEESLSYMNPYLPTIGIESWESTIPGFTPSALPAEF